MRSQGTANLQLPHFPSLRFLPLSITPWYHHLERDWKERKCLEAEKPCQGLRESLNLWLEPEQEFHSWVHWVLRGLGQ